MNPKNEKTSQKRSHQSAIASAARDAAAQLGEKETAKLLRRLADSLDTSHGQISRPRRTRKSSHYETAVSTLVADVQDFADWTKGKIDDVKKGTTAKAARQLLKRIPKDFPKMMEKRIEPGLVEAQKEFHSFIDAILRYGHEHGSKTFEDSMKFLRDVVRQGKIPPRRYPKK